MAWNDSGNGKDPWKNEDQGPTDLDKIFNNWRRRFRGIVGGGSGGGGASSSGGYVLVIVLLIVWIATGWYKIDQAELGVEQRFGAYTVTKMPGLRWHMPFPIETVDIVNVEAVNEYQFRNEMLTADEQYVLIDMVVQYRRTDPFKFSFLVEDPEITLQDVTESALRGVVGTSSLELLIGERRAQIPLRTQEELQNTLSDYGAGITVTSINLSVVDYPDSVKEAVDDTQKARNDRDKTKLEATTYANGIIPRARGAAQRVLQDAEAYRDRAIADADGEAARFEALLVEYQKAPRVTRDRLYIEAIEEVYGRSTKVILDSEGSGNMIYLPIDKLMERRQPGNSGSPDGRASDSQVPQASSDAVNRDISRERRTRQ